MIAITDVQQAQAGYDTAVAQEISAQQTLATAHEFLREIIGEDFPKLAGPKEDFPLRNPDPTNQEEWVRRALSDNLTLNAQRFALEVANEQINIDRGSRYPKVTLSAGYTRPDSGHDAVALLPAGLRYPVADDDQLVAVPNRQQLVVEPHVPALHGRHRTARRSRRRFTTRVSRSRPSSRSRARRSGRRATRIYRWCQTSRACAR